jgi:hypothetical protein
MASKTGLVLKLVGEDGNAFAILGRAHNVMRKGGKESMWKEFDTEATSGDYNHLLCTCMEWFDEPGDEEEEEDYDA